MSNEDLMMAIMSFIIGAISTYMVVYRDNLVAIGNLLFTLIMIAIIVGLGGIAAALGMVGVAFVFACYIIYLIYLRIKIAYQRRKRG